MMTQHAMKTTFTAHIKTINKQQTVASGSAIPDVELSLDFVRPEPFFQIRIRVSFAGFL